MNRRYNSSCQTETSRRRVSVGDPAQDSCEALTKNIDAFGAALCWFPDTAARRKWRLPVENDGLMVSLDGLTPCKAERKTTRHFSLMPAALTTPPQRSISPFT